MNKKAFLGTLIWLVILFLVISAAVFFIAFRNAQTSTEDIQKNITTIAPENTSENQTVSISEIPDETSGNGP
jgi:large-conductance mechanosensitive channel